MANITALLLSLPSSEIDENILMKQEQTNKTKLNNSTT